MKITKVDVFKGRSGKLNPVLIRISTDAGLEGWGEAGVAYGKGASAAAGMICDLAPFLIGTDPTAIEAFLTQCRDHTFWGKNGGTIFHAAVSACEMAMWDILGKQLQVPIRTLMGGSVIDDLPCYANGWYEASQSPDDFARAVERPMKDGFKAIKFYPLGQMVGQNMRHVSRRQISRAAADLAVDRVRAVRDAVGPDVDIMLDLSGGITAAEVIRLCERFAEFDIRFVEEPVDPADIAGLAEVSRSVAMPVAAGERHYTRDGFRPLMEQRAISIAQPDPGNTGGLAETRKIAAMAEAFGMLCAPHVCASPLMTEAALQVGATLPNFMTMELYPYFRHHDGWVDFVRTPAETRAANGMIRPSDAPGIGVEIEVPLIEHWHVASVT
ncbi:mandelate racemase/muconate lactonizing enzyme family protein [Salipiger sp. PrR002]|uniref:mandelate racemase/muconate lactonizing enzyme family protein n=1 Tax=Salipiger sp. PrR002 TaxID=2706489 RepID=UPI0013B90089|nr:mandelate racemase/muconate lactonizing enzyme family protein [Salipiger sp. PrR002]NDW01992.1 mandelate racemase/muconate lactonizing enzyme family protein [Salipiger sp. PrR002]NDW59032.1 mandelate racemase/muconate lactonizing enzyme family protein [Salipiger sp. PrR004]